MRRGACSLFALCALLLESLAVGLLFSGRGPFSALTALCAHAAAAGCAVVATCEPSKRSVHAQHSAREPLDVAMWFLGLALPGFGPIAALMLPAPDPTHQPPRSAEQSMQRMRQAKAQEAAEQRRSQTWVDTNVTALVDALRSTDSEIRLEAIGLLQQKPSATQVRMLHQARLNAEFDVRMRAAQSLGAIARHYTLRIAEAKQRASSQDDAAANLELAHACLDYLALGVEPGTAARRYAHLAMRAASVAVRRGGDRRAAAALAQAQKDVGQLIPAERLLRQMVEQDPTDLAACLALADAQYRLRDYESLRHTCRSLLSRCQRRLSAKQAAALKLWAKRRGQRRQGARA